MANHLIRYLLVGFGFLLFFISFIVSFETINSSSHLLGEIKEKHFTFFTLTETMRKEIQQHESDIYLFLIYRHDFNKRYHYKSITDIEEKIADLIRISDDLKIKELAAVISVLHKKIDSSYVLEKNLIDEFPRKDRKISDEQIQEYILQGREIHETISALTDLAKQNFLEAVNDLVISIEKSKHNIMFVLIGGLIILIISFSSLIRINKKFARQLERAAEAEAGQKALQKEIILHNQNLENEVAQKSAEASYRYYHDSLTNLPNRLKLMEYIDSVRMPKLALFNIDKFQHFNDYFGTKRGDNAIIFLSNKLNYLIEEPLLLFHLGGDEFAIFCDEALSDEMFMKRTLEVFDQIKSFEVIEAENRLILNITAGFALGKGGIFSKADIALKQAKLENREYLLYDDKKRIQENFLKHLNQLRELSYAINKDQLEIYLQPICGAKTKEIEKYEVLVRLRDSKGAIVAPSEFLQVSKEAKLYPKITEIVFRKTMELINRGRVKCSINISMDDIIHKKTRMMFMEGLRESAYAEHLTFELLESEDIEKYDKVQTFIHEVKSLGAKLAIDDFGTGYSNFDHLMHLDANFVKIDGSLIKGIEDDTLSQNFVRAMVGFAKELGIKTVAEYVASETIYNELLRYGVDYVQGYWLGKPEPVEYYINELS